MEVNADRDAEAQALLDELRGLRRNGDADGVGEDDLRSASVASAPRELEHEAWVDGAFEGQPNATLIVAVARMPSAEHSECRLGSGDGLLHRHVRVPLAEALGRSERQMRFVEIGRQ